MDFLIYFAMLVGIVLLGLLVTGAVLKRRRTLESSQSRPVMPAPIVRPDVPGAVDVVVVGAGVCGLQLAALLSSDGLQTLVLEKLPQVGGRAFLWEKSGFTVDNGIHLIRFGPRSATARVFRHIGAPLMFVDLGVSCLSFPDGRTVDFPTTPKDLLHTRMLGIRERLKIMSLLLKLRFDDPHRLLDQTVADWISSNRITGAVREYMHLVSASMQVCPDLSRSSAGEMLLNIRSVVRNKRSVMYPELGWRYLLDTLVDTVHKCGDVRTSSTVARVIVEQGRATGVELESGERIAAAVVVVNLPCQHLHRVLDESQLPQSFATQCRSLRPTAGVCLDFGLSRRVSEHSGLWYLWEPMSFGMFTSNLCPGVAPEGKQLLTWFAPTALEDIEDSARARVLQQRLEHEIFRVFPGLSDAIEWKRPMLLKMVDGVEVNVDQHRNKRIGYTVPDIEGLFLVGDSLRAAGAGGDIGHESVLDCYTEITGRRV